MSESEEKGVTILDAVRRAKEIAAAAKANAAPLNGDDAANRKRSHDEESEGGPAVKKPASDSHGIGPSPAAGQIDPKAIARQAIMNLTCRVGLTQMVTVEIKIPNRLVGLVIGHQGEMISRLQSESGARIQVAPDGSEINGERQVTISGTQDTVEKAKALVEKTVREVGLIDLPNITAAGHEVVEMMIPSNKIGLIIGKGGDMIKALQERAGCRMQMLQDGQYATTPEKPLRMTGNPESCRRARELVIELIEQKEMESGNFTVSWMGNDNMQARGLMMTNLGSGTGTLEVQVPRPMVGVIIGKNGECINNIQQTCGVRLQFLNDDLKSPYRAATISGSHDGIERAHKMVQDIISERSQGGGALMPGGRPFINLPNPTGPGIISTQLSVPSTKCGIVIGKSGETIRQLQVQSGCHIELDRGPDINPNEKIFNIRGSPQAVQAAQNLVWQKCDMTPGTGIVGGSTAINFATQQPQGMGYQQPGQQMYQQPVTQQGGASYNPQQQVVAAAAAAAVQNPWGAAYNPYQQYAAQAQQGQAQGTTDANQAAWAAYYQQYYAAQAAAAAGQTAGQQPQQQAQQQQQPTTVATTAAAQQDYTAQWAEYYRQLGYSYPYQQPQQQQQQQPQQQQPQQQQPGMPQQVQQVPQQQQQPQPGQVQQMPPPGAMGQQMPMQQMQQMPPGMPGSAPTENK